MDKDKTSYGNRSKGRIKGSSKVVNFDQEEILLRKWLSTNMKQPCDQRWNINFKKYKHFSNNKHNEVLMKKVMSEKYFRGLQDLGPDKVFLYEEGRTTKIFEHLSQNYELSHVDWVIKGKADDQVGGHANFE